MRCSGEPHGDVAHGVDLHEAEVLGALPVAGQAADGDVRTRLPVCIHEGHVVHAVPGSQPTPLSRSRVAAQSILATGTALFVAPYCSA